MSKTNIIKVIDLPSVLELLPIVLKIKKETFLLVIMHHVPDPLSSFIHDFIDK